ncbi:MAG: hypothetical protein GC205_07960 [Bacteroidetes bacterium]|nr:hypothetical protein [Bacteroidota bacterium]
MNYLPESRIERELNKLLPVTVPYNLRRHFPFKELGQRRLELLLFALFRRGLESGAFKKEFDHLNISHPVEGLGRIGLLQYRKQAAGAVLCMQQETPLNPGDLMRHLLLFTEFSAQHSLFKATPAPRIFLVVPGGVDAAVQALTQDWPAGLDNRERPSVSAMEDGVAKGAEDPGGTEKGKSQPATPLVLTALDRDRLRALDIEWLLPVDLDPMLVAEPDIKSLFFAVEMVAPEQSLRRILGEFRVEELGAPDMAALLAKISANAGPSMNAVGLIRFFGYPREFLRQLVKDKALREIMIKGAEFKAELDYAVLDFLHRKCQMIGKVLLAAAPVSPNSPAMQAVVPYVFSRMVIKYLKNTNSKVLQEIARSGARRDFYEDANLDLIRADLLALAVDLAEQESDAFLAEDLQERARLEALRQAALEQPDPVVLARQFAEDWEALQPSVRSMEKKLLSFLPRDPVLLLDDFGSLNDDKGKASRLLEGFKKRFQKPEP